MNNLTTCFDRDPNVVARKIEDEFILVPIRQNIGDLGSIYVLNDVAASIWELIDGRNKVVEIRDMILEQFEVSPQEAENDMVTLLEQFMKLGVVRVAEG